MSPISYSIVKITTWQEDDDNVTSPKYVASGFIWIENGRSFLVTAKHVVTGVNPITRSSAHKPPTHINIRLWTEIPKGCRGSAENVLSRRDQTFPLYVGDAPQWMQSELEEIDIAMMHLDSDSPEAAQFFPLNVLGLNLPATPRSLNDGYIGGFPEAIEGPFGSPIFKRASIASEPSHSLGTQGDFLVDTVGNGGLSGGPVFLHGTGISPANRRGVIDRVGEWMTPIGVYAGRLSDSGIGLQLGRVWKIDRLAEISERGCQATPHPHK